MNNSLRLVVAGGVILLAPCVAAQAYQTSPIGYEQREGVEVGYGLGAYPAGRYMCFDGAFRGPAMTLKGTAYRYDDRVYVANGPQTTGQGRSWSRVDIDAAECDVANLSATYSANQTTTPTRVFSAPVTWPDFDGKPLLRPAAWTLLFPFSTNWSYSGTQDICLDYRFAGGTLANNGTWSTRLPPLYYKDSATVATSHLVRGVKLGNWGTMFGGCSDRGARSTQGAYLTLSSTYYGPAYSQANLRDRITFTQDGQFFGVSSAVVTVLGFRADVRGTPFPGVGCNKLHVDMTLPTIWYRQIATTGGTLPRLTFGMGATGVAADPSMSGAELVTQAGWEDTRTKALQISAAAQLFLPTRPRDFKRSCLYGDSTSAATGTGPSTRARDNEIVRYTN